MNTFFLSILALLGTSHDVQLPVFPKIAAVSFDQRPDQPWIYLTKTNNGITHHYRTKVVSGGVDIVEGQFYRWIVKRWIGCGGQDSAERKQKQLVDQKLAEGFQIIDFIEKPENTRDRHDEAEWHLSADFPEDMDAFQAYVYTGIFVTWLIENDLVSSDFKKMFKVDISRVKKRKLTGPKFFQRNFDGVLALEHLNETGNRFALAYLDFENGQYLKDYESLLAEKLPSIYHVKDTWENYQKMKVKLDDRYKVWLRDKK